MKLSTCSSLLFSLFLMYSSISQVTIKGEYTAQFSDEIKDVYGTFGELQNTKIIFKSAKISTSLNARPTILSLLFRRRTKRTYVVRINCSEKDSIITLDEVPKEAVVGVIGHELCHIVDYHQKSFWGVLGRGFAYLSKKKKSRFEKEIDSVAISRGFGEGVYSWSDYLLNHSDATKKYKEFKRLIYLEPEEIKEIMKLYDSN